MKKHPVYTMLIIGVAVLIFAPIIWGSRQDPLWKFIYNFQTLITGVLAVLAALITVKKMQETDDAQWERHRELLDLTMQRERNLVKRAIYTDSERVNHVQNRFSRRFSTYHAGLGENYMAFSEEPRNDFLDRNFIFLYNSAMDVAQVFNQIQIKEVLRLLEPRGLAAYQTIMASCKQVKDSYDIVHEAIKGGEHATIIVQLALMRSAFKDINDGLEEWSIAKKELMNDFGII